MKHTIFIFFLLMLSANDIDARKMDFAIELNSGIATFDMGDLRGVNWEVLEAVPFPAEITSDFPPYIFYQGTLLFGGNSTLNIGFCFAYYSTGSRVSYKDYSGEYKFDILMSSTNFGLVFDLNLNKNKDQTFFFKPYVRFGLMTSQMDAFESTRIADVQQKDADSWNLTGIHVEPGLKFIYNFGLYGVGANAGYQFDTGLGVDDVSDWNGLRAGIFVKLHLTKLLRGGDEDDKPEWQE